MENKVMKKMLPLFYILVILSILGIVYYEFIDNKSDRNTIQKIDVISSTVNLKYGQSYQIELDPIYNEIYAIVWESSNPSLVSVDNNGKLFVNGNQDGSVIIKAFTNDQKLLANVTVEVTKIDTVIHVEEIKIDKNEVNLKYGETEKINAIVSPENATNKEVIWTSSNPDLVNIDYNGNIKIKKNENGEAILTVATLEGNYSASIIVKVTYVDQTVKVDSVKLNKDTISLKYGETEKLTAIIYPENATNKDVVWESSNPILVIIDNDGNIKTNSNQNGESIITVKTIDGNYTANASIKIEAVEKEKKVTGLKLNKSEVKLKYGEEIKITPTISPSNATNKALIWESSNPNLVSIDEDGNIKAVGNKDDTAIITVKTLDGGYTKTVNVIVSRIKATGITLNKNSMNLRYNKSEKLTATVTPSNASNKKVTWTSSDSSIATVSTNGTVTATGSGKAVIAATTKDGSYKATCTVTVDRKKYTVQFDSNGGSSIKKQNVLEGNKVKQPSNPTKEGYIFNGWLLNNLNYNFDTEVTSNMTLIASWLTDYNAVDYCSNMPISYNQDNIILKNCLKDIVVATTKKSVFMQNFSITSNYVYFSAALNGAWIKGYSSTDLNDEQKYNEIVDSSNFANISSIFITRIDKSTSQSKITEIKYSGHGQGFDTVSGATDYIYLTAIASPMYHNNLVGAASSGIYYTTFKQEGGTRIPGVTVVFNSSGAVADRILSTNFTQNGVFNSSLYFDTIRGYAKDSSMRKKIVSLAVDEKNDKLVYTVGKKTYIYSLSEVTNGTATAPLKEFNTVSNQGLELDGENLYVTTNNGTIIGLHKYNISTGEKIKSIEMDLGTLYSNRIEKGSVIEIEGISIYNANIYIGIVSRENGIGYNDIYLVEGF